MGLILDTSVLVKAERTEAGVLELAMDLKRLVGTQPLGICVISLSELAQGQAQARGSRRAQLRASFVRELQETFPMYEISEQIAIRGGLLSGTLQSNGLTIGLADVLIAATALESVSAC